MYINNILESININNSNNYNVSNKEIKQQTYWYEPRYVSYCLNDLSLKQILLENTGITLKPDYVVKYLKWKLKLKDWQFNKDIFHNNVTSITAEYIVNNEISIVIPDIKNNKEIIINILNHFGYYLDTYNETEQKDWIVMVFHPAYMKSVKDEIKHKYNFLYHITDFKNKDKILKNGFITKSSDDIFKYPPRCHFFY